MSPLSPGYKIDAQHVGEFVDSEIISSDGMLTPNLWIAFEFHGGTKKNTSQLVSREYPVPLRSSLYDLLETSFLFYNFLKCHTKGSSFVKPNLLCPTPPVSANEKLLVWFGNKIVLRDLAKVSVFDGVVQFGGGAWEGLRIYDGKIFKFEDYIERLFNSAKALMFTNVPTREEFILSMIRHNYLLSNKIAKGHADVRKADDGIMLDVSGFVSGTTAANIFLMNGLVKISHYDCCFTGITRETVIDLLAKKSVIPEEGHIVPSDLYNADEVTMIDGRVIGDGQVGKLTRELQIICRNLTNSVECCLYRHMTKYQTCRKL